MKADKWDHLTTNSEWKAFNSIDMGIGKAAGWMNLQGVVTFTVNFRLVFSYLYSKPVIVMGH